LNKALIVYGTRYGATASTSEEIAATLKQEGIDTRVVNLKKDKVKNIIEYELVIVGSGIQINKWTGEPEKFLKKFQKELASKKVALFVCCGSAQPLDEKEDKAKTIENARTKYLEEKAAKCNLQPVALGLFGGVYNFNNMSWFFRKTMSAVKPQLEEAGFKETQPGLYDTRDLNAIRNWAKELAQKIRCPANSQK
jgi:menaquinone-dependent protoporphyrinogen oxidase